MDEASREEIMEISEHMRMYHRIGDVLEDEDIKALDEDRTLERAFWENQGSLEDYVPNRDKDYYDKMRMLYRELDECYRFFKGQEPNEWFEEKIRQMEEELD